MKYIGIPNCPYCKKGVNLIRVWSVKKHGEYLCPRCKGISNIYLSPLTYVLAVLAIAAGFLIYFFNKFVMDSVSLMTAVYVLIPFAVFFLLTLFMVYFEKPVIKKVRKTEDGRYFDQNGNELKMKMGKLVTATGNTGLLDIPPSTAVRNSSDMTGQMQRAPRQSAVQQPASRAGEERRNTAPANQNAPRKTPASELFEAAPEQHTAPKHSTPTFVDNEALYASAAEKLGKNFTREIQKDEVISGLKEIENKTAAAQQAVRQEQRAQTPAPVRERPQTAPEQRMRPAAAAQQAVRQEQRAQTPAPVRERPQAAPEQRIRPAAAAQQADLPVGKVAQERNAQRSTKSGFEDLIAEYDRLANQQTGEIPVRRKKTSDDETKRKNSGFRQL